MGLFSRKKKYQDMTKEERNQSDRNVSSAEMELRRGNIRYGMTFLDSEVEIENPEALYVLASCYINGIGVRKNNDTALSYMSKSAKFGYYPAIKVLCSLAFHGVESAKKEVQSIISLGKIDVERLEKDAEWDDQDASNSLYYLASLGYFPAKEMIQKLQQALRSFAQSSNDEIDDDYDEDEDDIDKTDNVVEAIKKYKQLLDMGAITVEEYNAKKRQLLGL